MRSAILFLLRLSVAVAVLAMSIIRLESFAESVYRLTAYGFPAARLFLSLSLLAGFSCSVLLLAGVFVRRASGLLIGLFVLPLSVFFSMYSGSVWGEYQWLLQLLRLLEPAYLVISLFVLFLAGGGRWSVARLRDLRSGPAARPVTEAPETLPPFVLAPR